MFFLLIPVSMKSGIPVSIPVPLHIESNDQIINATEETESNRTLDRIAAWVVWTEWPLPPSTAG